ncbi:MAG: ATP-binding protein [Candidatus Aegiribacteria sp.]|nr:ATP-binding protein [Candidatus Aegiribacteria sp.]
MGFDRVDCAQVALAVSEISGNAHKFAGRGTVALQLTANKKGLEIIVRDRGQGIGSIKKVMAEGYSSESLSLGVGLNAAKRAVDELSIRSKVGQGTKVVMRKFLPLPEEEIEYGVISMPDERYPGNAHAKKNKSL